MSEVKKDIRLCGHAIEQLRFRGCSEEEVIFTIRSGKWHKAERNRLECQHDFPFKGLWNGKEYKKKRVRPIFVDEENEIVVVTVYTYYIS